MPIPSEQATHARLSLREHAAQRLRTAILDGTLHPGERLNDLELQQWLGISRTPLREALHDLARDGFIEMKAQRFTRVAPADESSALEYLQMAGALLGGVLRVTIPTLPEATAQTLAHRVDELLDLARRRDVPTMNLRAQVLVEEVIHYCRNRVLADATKNLVAGALYRVSASGYRAEDRWDEVVADLTTLRTAIAQREAIAAELAIERILLIPADSATPAAR